ncbi:MAG: patatin-like phospholipase family protein [Roseicyclus sp.]
MRPFGLALSGGGASGLGHIPVIDELDRAGARPEAIAGTSIGALIGACMAGGMTAGRIETHVTGLTSDFAGMGRRLLRMAAWSELGLGLFLDPERIVRIALPEGLPDRIEDMPIPLTVIATDFYRQREVRFTKGPLAPALAASIAIPGLFSPVVVAGRVYVDGGVSNNLPIEALPEGLPVIAVDAVTKPPDETATEVPGPLMASLGAMRILMRALLERQLRDRAPFALLRPASCRFGPLDFLRTDEILKAAEPVREETRQALRRLAELEPTAG